MRLLNDVYEINMHVFMARVRTYPQLLYSEVELANRIIYEAYTVLDEPAGRTYLYRGDTEAESYLGHWRREIAVGGLAGGKWLSATSTRPRLRRVEWDAAAGEQTNIWGAKDGFLHLYREIEGDFVATVRLELAPDTNNWSKAGIMLRVQEDRPRLTSPCSVPTPTALS